jgi:hypothetical protein
MIESISMKITNQTMYGKNQFYKYFKDLKKLLLMILFSIKK